MSDGLKCFVLAGIGGLLPTLSKLAAAFAAQPDQPLPHWHITIALSIFFVLGCVLNVPFNREHDLTKAVMVGIAAPALITNIIAGVASAPSNASTSGIRTSSNSPSIVSQAAAQEPIFQFARDLPQDGQLKILIKWNIQGYINPDNDQPIFSVRANDRVIGQLQVGKSEVLFAPASTTTLA